MASRRPAGSPGPASADPARVLILTTFGLDEYVVEALRAGASGFLLKDIPPEDLIEAIHVIAAGEALLAPSVTRRLLDRFASPPAGAAETPPPPLGELTERELEVLRLVAQGLSNAEIAERLRRLRDDREDPRLARVRQARPSRPRPGGDPAYQAGLV